MKTKSILFATGVSVMTLAIAAVSPAQADIKEAARKLNEESNAAMIGIKGLLKIDVTMKGQPAGNQESPIWGNGLIIGDGLAVTAYQTLVPDVAAQAPRGGLPEGVEIKTKLTEIKFVDPSGEEYDAKLILHDEDLDLAFLAIDPKAENAGDWKVAPVGITSDPEVLILDDVIGMARQSSTLRFATELKIGTVTTVVPRPRLLYAVDGISPGAPTFTADGTFLGLVTIRKSGEKTEGPVPVILPAKYIRPLVSQALEKQEALKSGGDEEVEEVEETDSVEVEEAAEEPAAEVPAETGGE